MIERRTTKEIILDNFDMPKSYKFSNGEDKEVWLRESDVKKEIDKFLHDYEVENIKYCELQEEIYKRLGLCNSQEQESKFPCEREKFTLSVDEKPVSCEHKTGEGESPMSSPVQNPKKCTCKEPRFMMLRDDKCGRCGGDYE